jgi:bifunctional oligoribonuclease and PAP phosphatase NrnA
LTTDDIDPVRTSGHESLKDIPAVAASLRDVILKHTSIAVVTHSNADADAVASVLTMRAVCEHFDRKPVLTVTGDGEIPQNLMFLNDILTLTENPDDLLLSADLIIYVDCAEASRIGPLYDRHSDFLELHQSTVNIDHHVTNTRFADLNCVIPVAAATAEILELMREELRVPINSELATAMLAGIYGDTLGLRTPSTTPSTMRVSAALVEAGAEIDTVVDWLFRVKPYSAVVLWAEALGKSRWSGPVIWTRIDQDMLDRAQATAGEAEGLINFLAGTIGARAAALAYEEPAGWRVSLRSVHDAVDVATIAQEFGGGGHPRAAGLRLQQGDAALLSFIESIAGTIASLTLDGEQFSGSDDSG